MFNSKSASPHKHAYPLLLSHPLASPPLPFSTLFPFPSPLRSSSLRLNGLDKDGDSDAQVSSYSQVTYERQESTRKGSMINMGGVLIDDMEAAQVMQSM